MTRCKKKKTNQDSAGYKYHEMPVKWDYLDIGRRIYNSSNFLG